MRVLGNCGSTKQCCRFENSRTNRGLKRKIGSQRTPRTNFFKLLEMEVGGKVPSAEEDLRLEKRFAKKLKLKKGKMSAADDLCVLVEGTSSSLDHLISKNSGKDVSLVDENVDAILDDGEDEEFGPLFNSDDDDDDVYDGDDSDFLGSSEREDMMVAACSPKKSNKGTRKKTKLENSLENDIKGPFASPEFIELNL